jgi:hypothetical protein
VGRGVLRLTGAEVRHGGGGGIGGGGGGGFRGNVRINLCSVRLCGIDDGLIHDWGTRD